jgi:hypothetical protein
MTHRVGRPRVVAEVSCYLMMCFALRVLPSVAQEQQSSKLATWSTMAVAFFVEVKDTFNDMVILPAARENLARDLRAFSQQLFDLQQRKSDLTKALLSIPAAGGASARQRLVDQARNDITRQADIVNKMRGSLRQILVALPPAYREQGNKVVDSLELGLDDKVATLNDISRQLIGGAFDRDKITQEGEHAVEVLQKLKASTDEFLSVVEKKPSS